MLAVLCFGLKVDYHHYVILQLNNSTTTRQMALLERQYLHQKKLQEEAQRRRSERETIRQYRLEEEAKRRRGLWLRELQKESERQQMMEIMQDIYEERPDAHQFKFSQIPMRSTLYSDLDSNLLKALHLFHLDLLKALQVQI